MAETAQDTTRCGFVALIGAPNAGKSTLLNALVGAKVAIVTHKVQTTRTRVTGIGMLDNAQLVFIDTPGIFEPKRRLDRAMVNAAWKGSEDAESTLLLIDAKKGINDEVRHIVAGLRAAGRRALLAINKIDTIKREQLLVLAQMLHDEDVFDEIFMVSALTGDGVPHLKAYLAKIAPKSPWLYPEDQIADVTMRILAAEITREKIYMRLHDELPYSTTVETEKWEERPDGSVRIEQVIHVERDSQKGIVIGKGGTMLKLLGQMAREDMAENFDRKVHLFLHVRVTERWAEDRTMYKDMGLDYVD